LVPARIVTVPGTVARLVLSEWRLIVSGLGVVADSVSVTFWLEPPVMATVAGGKLTVAVTLTVTLLAPKPPVEEEALIVAEPTATPVIVG